MAKRHKSALKRNRQNERRQDRNTGEKTQLKTLTKKFLKSVAEGDTEAAKGLYLEVSSKFDKAAKKGLVHKNLASRKKSRLAVKLNGASAKGTQKPAAKSTRTATKKSSSRKK